MATQPRPSHTSSDQNQLDLLQTLLDAPPAPSGARLGPVVLRSATQQRRYALRSYALRTWFDGALFYAERLLNRFDRADVVRDITPWLDAKVAAALCHRTQHAMFLRNSSVPQVRDMILRVESFRRWV